MLSHARSFSSARRFAVAAAIASCAISLSACGGSSDAGSSSRSSADGGVSVADAWTKATDGPMTGSFGILSNSGTEDVTITSASSPAAGMVELHETVMVDGQMQMQQDPEGFTIPAGGTFVLEPGGYHIMLMGLPASIAPGEEVPITLTLSNGRTLEYTTVAKDFAGGNESYAPSESMSMG